MILALAAAQALFVFLFLMFPAVLRQRQKFIGCSVEASRPCQRIIRRLWQALAGQLGKVPRPWLSESEVGGPVPTEGSNRTA